MRVKIGAGVATVAALLVLWLTGGGDLVPPVPTPTPIPTPGPCLASNDCFPKPPGGGDGATGVPTDVTLTNCGSSATISVAGTTIDACTYTGNLRITANDVTIRNSRIMGSIETIALNTVIEDNEIGPSTGCASLVALVRWSNYTARRNYIHGNSDGFRYSGDDIIAEDNFVTTCDLPGDHSDGLQADGSGQNNIVHHNTIDIRAATYGPNAPVFFADNSESGTVTDNLLITSTQGVYALRLHDDHSPDIGPWIVTGNRLVGKVRTINTECGASTMTWNENRTVTVNPDYTIASTGSLVNC
jgi:hypothetical protein